MAPPGWWRVSAGRAADVALRIIPSSADRGKCARRPLPTAARARQKGVEDRYGVADSGCARRAAQPRRISRRRPRLRDAQGEPEGVFRRFVVPAPLRASAFLRGSDLIATAPSLRHLAPSRGSPTPRRLCPSPTLPHDLESQRPRGPGAEARWRRCQPRRWR